LRSSAELEAQVLAVRRDHPAWGGRKIRRVLEDEGLARAPSASTIAAILRRHGLLDGPGAGERRDWVRFEHAHPNDLWQMDFKGWFALPGRRCCPLTVLDDHSRYAIEIGACGDEQEKTVRARLEAVFRRHGLPWRILCDNGQPWGAAGNGEHTKLSVWLMDLDIAVSHGRPYHPQTQGKDERFHRTLKAEVLAGRTFKDLDEAQQAFDAWREVYNAKRPHEAIAMQTPARRYRMSQRPMPETILPAEYEPQAAVRAVDRNGRFAFKGRSFRWSRAFAGKRIALRATNQDGLFNLCYRRHVLGQLDLTENLVKTVHHVPEQVSTISPV
jgi:transposase InsO family protein